MTALTTEELRDLLARQTRDPGRMRTLHECATPGCARGTTGDHCAACLTEELKRRERVDGGEKVVP